MTNPAAYTCCLAVDVGGTWLRLRVGGSSSPVDRRPAPSLLNYPDRTVAALREELVRQLCEAAPPDATASISCGAAIDHRTGLLYGSGPMWGSESTPFDLAAQLRWHRPDVGWKLINDLTAGLADFVAHYARPGDRRIGYLTVSSGVGLRIADLRTEEVPIDEWGLQGEVGHLLTFADPGPELRSLMCECGVPNHVAAIASGPGVTRVADTFGVATGGVQVHEWLGDALVKHDVTARRVLRAVVTPIAELIRALWCLDPHLDLLGVGGGVVEGLAPFYAAELHQQLDSGGTCYANRGHTTAWVRDHLRLCDKGQIDCLRGAERMRDNFLRVAV